MGIIYFLGHFAIVSSLFPLFTFLITKKNKTHIYIKIYVIEVVLSNLINLLLFHFTKLNQDCFFWCNIFFETVLIAFVFLENNDSKVLKKIIYAFFILSTLLFLFTFKLELSIRFTFYGTFSRAALTILSILLIIERYLKSTYDSLFDDYVFNFSSAVLIYCGLQLYVMIFNNIILNQLDKLFLYTWPIIQISSIIYYLLISRAIWKLKN